MTRRIERRLPESAPVPIRPKKLGHVVLRVSDLSRIRDWYIAVLGARVVFGNDTVCFLTYDDEHHRIGLINRPDLGGAGDAHHGLEHISFTYESLEQLLANYRRLKRLEIEPYWSINHGPTISLYYRDPDGNRIELQHDVFERAEDVEAFFAGGAYEENFIGVIFDPEEMIARFESGESIADLTLRPKLPAGTSSWDMYVP